MHLKGRIRRLLSSSTTTTGNGNNPPQVQVSERSRRASDVSENSDISYDRSSGSFVQRVSTSLRRRSGKFRRASSEGGGPVSAFHFAEEKSFDGGSLSFSLAHDDSSRASPLRSQPQLPATPDSRKLVGGSPLAQSSDLPAAPQQRPTGAISAVNEEEEEEAEEEDDYAPVPSAWGDEPTPEQLQQIQDRVSAWLHTSRPSPSPTTPSSGSGLQRFPSTMDNTALLKVPEEEDDEQHDQVLEIPDPLVVRPQPLRTLDSISEDEPPTFAGSSVSTAPSTPFPLSSLPQLSRSRSQSPPLRRRSLEGPEEYYPRGLDTIQEAGGPLSTSLPSPRRSLDSAKQRPSSLFLESIPEIDLLPPSASTPTSAAAGSTSKRRLGIKGFGFARSESEPLMPTFRTNTFNPSSSSSTSGSAAYPSAKSRKAAPASLNFLAGSGTNSAKGPKSPGRIGVREASASSPTLPSFQRGTNMIMGQQQQRSSPTLPLSFTPKRGGQQEQRKALNPRTYSLGAIAAETEVIEDDESRRLTEVAFLG